MRGPEAGLYFHSTSHAYCPMPASAAATRRQRRAQLKAQGLEFVRGWVTRAQAEAIRAIMASKPVTYEPNQHTALLPEPEPSTQGDETVESTLEHHGKSLQLKPKSGQAGAWTVWLGSDELGTVYRHRVDAGEHRITVWVAYRPRGHNTRHETRDHAITALLQEYNGI